jgi:hypothetical protein
MNHVVTHGEDAVFEVELSSQDLQAITHAAAAKTAARRPRDLPRILVGLGAASVIAVVTLLIAQRTPHIRHAVPAAPIVVAPPVLAAATPAPDVELAAPPVKFPNPFDRKEVFEFPAGTSRAEAREKVAQLLLKRAQERRPTVRRVASSVERRNS